MPSAVSLFPASPPPPSTSSASTSGDSAPSKFDDALDQARQKDSSGADSGATGSASASTSTSTDKPGKDAKSAKVGKAVKASSSKASSKAKSQETDESDSKESTPATDDSADAASPALVPAAPLPTANTPANPKAKPAPHSGDEAPAPQLIASPQPAQVVQPVSKDPKESPRQPKDQPGDGTASVAPIKQDGNADPAQNPDAQAAASAAIGHAPAPTGNKLGAVVEKRPGAISAADSATAPSVDAAENGTAVLDAAAVASDGDLEAAASAAGNAAASGAEGPPGAAHAKVQAFSDVLASAQNQSAAPQAGDASAAHPAAIKLPPAPPEVRFAEANSATIVSSVHTQLLPNGGSMQIRLDPPDLGTMTVSVQMRDGVMTATFETSTDQAARLLTHNLGQLKMALETQGVSVGRLHVEQAPRDSQSNSRDSGKNSDGGANDQTSQQQQQDQQRRDMLRKMWRRLNGGKDPLDMVA